MNQLAILESRQQPLTIEDFNRLETAVEKTFTVKILTEGRSVPKIDANGDIYGWEHDVFETGITLAKKIEPDQRLLDALKRPSSAKAIAYHLTRLSAHKRNTRGGFGFQVIIEDAARDLAGVSEWALMKGCEKMRKAEGDFFPNLNEIVEAVKFYDQAVNHPVKKDNFIIPKMKSDDGWKRPTVIEKQRVQELLEKAGIIQPKSAEVVK